MYLCELVLCRFDGHKSKANVGENTWPDFLKQYARTMVAFRYADIWEATLKSEGVMKEDLLPLVNEAGLVLDRYCVLKAQGME